MPPTTRLPVAVLPVTLSIPPIVPLPLILNPAACGEAVWFWMKLPAEPLQVVQPRTPVPVVSCRQFPLAPRAVGSVRAYVVPVTPDWIVTVFPLVPFLNTILPLVVLDVPRVRLEVPV